MTNSNSDKLKFDNPVIVAGPAYPDIDLIKLLLDQNYHLIAADGGANHLKAHDLVPSAIIGDLDSLEDLEYWNSCTQVIGLVEQETTDFEKCIYSTNTPAYVASGFAANRLDHTLSTLHVMTKYAEEKAVYLCDDAAFSFVASGNFQVSVNRGDTVSIFPLSNIEFGASVGLKYPLNGLKMEIGSFVGTSNVAKEEQVSIVPKDEYLQTPYLISLPLDNLTRLINTRNSKTPI